MYHTITVIINYYANIGIMMTLDILFYFIWTMQCINIKINLIWEVCDYFEFSLLFYL